MPSPAVRRGRRCSFPARNLLGNLDAGDGMTAWPRPSAPGCLCRCGRQAGGHGQRRGRGYGADATCDARSCGHGMYLSGHGPSEGNPRWSGHSRQEDGPEVEAQPRGIAGRTELRGSAAQTTIPTASTSTSPTTEMMVSITDQVLMVWRTVIPKNSLISQKPASLTWEKNSDPRRWRARAARRRAGPARRERGQDAGGNDGGHGRGAGGEPDADRDQPPEEQHQMSRPRRSVMHLADA